METAQELPLPQLRRVTAKIRALTEQIRKLGKLAARSTEARRKDYLRKAFEYALARRSLRKELDSKRAEICDTLRQCLVEVRRYANQNKDRQVQDLAKLGTLISRSIFGQPVMEPSEVRGLLLSYAAKYQVPTGSPIWIAVEHVDVPIHVSMKAVVKTKRELERTLELQRERLDRASGDERLRLVKKILARPIKPTREIDLQIESFRAQLCLIIHCCFREVARLTTAQESERIRKLIATGVHLSNAVFGQSD